METGAKWYSIRTKERSGGTNESDLSLFHFCSLNGVKCHV